MKTKTSSSALQHLGVADPARRPDRAVLLLAARALAPLPPATMPKATFQRPSAEGGGESHRRRRLRCSAGCLGSERANAWAPRERPAVSGTRARPRVHPPGVRATDLEGGGRVGEWIPRMTIGAAPTIVVATPSVHS